MGISTLVKLACLGVLVVLGFDGANLVRTAYGADRDASSAAKAATSAYDRTKDVQQAYDAAVAELGGEAVIDPATFSMAADGEVRLSVRRTSDSVVLGRVREAWTVITVDGRAGRPS